MVPSGNRAVTVGNPIMAGDKLILTPALREVVDEASPNFAPPIFVPHPRQTVPSDAVGLEQVVATLGAAVGPQSNQWEAETGDTGPDFDAAQAEDVAQAAAHDWAMPEPQDHAAADLAAPQNFVFADAPAAEEVILAAEPAPEEIPGWAQDDGNPLADDDSAAMSAPAQGTLEPDPEWADAAEASVIAELSSDGPFADDADAAFTPQDDTMLFNEEVLRDLVRDILREELAGKMGERITRNIRKLVRAEIARSFAAQEFD